MKKAELIAAVAQSAAISKRDADRAVSAVFDVITKALVERDRVQIVGFGTFETRERSEREGKNPQTGEKIMIAASTVPAFKAGRALKEAVNAK